MSWWLLVNSLFVATAAIVIAIICGFSMALWVATCRGKSALILLALSAASIALPPFLAANSWLELTAGWRANWPQASIHATSLAITALILGLLYWPLITFLLLAAWRRIQTEQLEVDPCLTGWALIRFL